MQVYIFGVAKIHNFFENGVFCIKKYRPDSVLPKPSQMVYSEVADCPLFTDTSSVRCPVVVQLLSSCCPVSDWTTTGQQLDNKRTTSGVDRGVKRRFSGDGREKK